MINGGYDSGYLNCPCFWGENPGSLVLRLDNFIDYSVPLSVLDVGCGEGKNSIFFARKGAKVVAMDISEAALNNAKKAWKDHTSVNWVQSDVRKSSIEDKYDIVVAYGLFHCYETLEEIKNGINKIKMATKENGYNLLCAFNDRHQDLSAHPDFSPTLLNHDFYKSAYSDWEIIYISDEDLHETHPHNNIPHSHSLTRLIARKLQK